MNLFIKLLASGKHGMVRLQVKDCDEGTILQDRDIIRSHAESEVTRLSEGFLVQRGWRATIEDTVNAL